MPETEIETETEIKKFQAPSTKIQTGHGAKTAEYFTAALS